MPHSQAVVDRDQDASDRPSIYLIFMLLVSILALCLLATEVVGSVDSGTQTILGYADTILCGLFLVDFVVSLYRAPNKLKYFFTWGWLDLISSIPVLDSMRWGRAARAIRILRLLRGFRSARVLAQFVLKRRTQSGLLAAALLVLVLLTFGSIAVLHAERPLGEGANIRTAEDALWWSITTLTTVGYGDRYPVSTEGRLVAVVLMVTGVGLFGALSGLVAAAFLAPAETKVDDDIIGLREEIRELKAMLAKHAPPNREVSPSTCEDARDGDTLNA